MCDDPLLWSLPMLKGYLPVLVDSLLVRLPIAVTLPFVAAFGCCPTAGLDGYLACLEVDLEYEANVGNPGSSIDEFCGAEVAIYGFLVLAEPLLNFFAQDFQQQEAKGICSTSTAPPPATDRFHLQELQEMLSTNRVECSNRQPYIAQDQAGDASSQIQQPRPHIAAGKDPSSTRVEFYELDLALLPHVDAFVPGPEEAEVGLNGAQSGDEGAIMPSSPRSSVEQLPNDPQ
ncbi:hypothetical protein Nepgr_020438 [Nepenthes gracilis]|uniref:Uncharacterized protein n=1 Tax=Nepenthes gracilis TaxID=150966 RepID=A0AAD3XV26_NEPGR|nr:hypothetical protein Nepgr_020438 [Nepenthes gracilis]